MTLLEGIAVATSFLAIWCTARRWLICWPLNLLACALYFKLFYDVRLYSDMALQGLFGTLILYGWVSWLRGKDDDGEVVITPLLPTHITIGLIAGTLGAVSLGWVTSTFTNAAVPWMDAALSSFSVVAQIWTAKRKAASWLLWIAVDVLYVGMFIHKELWLTAGLYAAMIGIAVQGYFSWRKAEREGLPV